LKDYAGAKPLRGILTGLNEAFIIDAGTRQQIVKASKKSEEVIRPLLRGRDADRWRGSSGESFLITIPSSENVDWPWSDAGAKAEEVFRRTYPAIYDHFLPFKKALVERQDQGRFYWELRSCDYMHEFDKPKIVYQDLAWFSEFAQDDGGCVPNNTVYVIPTNDQALLAILNSPVLWWYMWRTAQHGKDEVLRLFTDFVVTLPIPSARPEVADSLRDIVEQAVAQQREIQGFDAEFVDTATNCFSLPERDTRLVSWLPLQPDTFSSRLLRLANARQPTPKLREEVAGFQRTYRTRQVKLLTRLFEVERKLAVLVEDAYGLTPEERALLRSTRPVRDPLDVMEAKIQGGREAETNPEADD
jgi:hypothetical protein